MIHFRPPSAFWASPSVNQAQSFSYVFSWSYKTFSLSPIWLWMCERGEALMRRWWVAGGLGYLHIRWIMLSLSLMLCPGCAIFILWWTAAGPSKLHDFALSINHKSCSLRDLCSIWASWSRVPFLSAPSSTLEIVYKNCAILLYGCYDLHVNPGGFIVIFSLGLACYKHHIAHLPPLDLHHYRIYQDVWPNWQGCLHGSWNLMKSPFLI